MLEPTYSKAVAGMAELLRELTKPDSHSSPEELRESYR